MEDSTAAVFLSVLFCAAVCTKLDDGSLASEIYWAFGYIKIAIMILWATFYWLFFAGTKGVQVSWNTHNGTKYIFRLNPL